MQTRREYAISLGLAKDGRGRMSGAAHAAIDEAVKNGMSFSDMPSRGVGKQIDSKDVSKGNPEDSFSATPEPFHNGNWFATVNNKRVKISGRSVCTTCGYSLDYQNCLTPSVVGPDSEIVRVSSR